MNNRKSANDNLMKSETLVSRVKKSLSFLGLIGISMLISGCVTNSSGISCGGLEAIRLTKSEYNKLSDRSALEYAKQLRVGQANCGWRPR